MLKYKIPQIVTLIHDFFEFLCSFAFLSNEGSIDGVNVKT